MKYPYFTEHEAMKIAQAVVAALPASEKKGGKVLAALLAWCQIERGKLVVDGYDYKSGEEFGIRRVELQIEKALLSLNLASEKEGGKADPISFANQELEELLRRVRAGSLDAEADIREMFAALAPLPDGEAVAWRWRSIFNEDHWCYDTKKPVFDNDQYIAEPLYASPPPCE